MKKHIDHFFTNLIDWLFRRRSPEVLLIKTGGAILLALLGVSYAFDIKIPTSSGDLKLTFSFNQGTSEIVVFLALIAAILAMLYGCYLVYLEHKENSRKQVVAIELRGLRDTSGSPLKDYIPSKVIGRRHQILTNIRRNDGRIFDPEDAIQQINFLPAQISTFEAGLDRSDISFYAGGMASVPFSFLMGVLLDDESKFQLMDWDRDQERWRVLDSDDDMDRFKISGLDNLADAEELVLSVSVSYYTNKQAIAQSFPNLPVVHMELTNVTTENHWSQNKQIELAKEFFSLCRSLCATKVKTIHLILAAQNSVVIQFGRKYDKRNLPSIVVWQYENGKKDPYPWGIAMPVAGTQTAKIFKRN